jgi:hypothetical protein
VISGKALAVVDMMLDALIIIKRCVCLFVFYSMNCFAVPLLTDFLMGSLCLRYISLVINTIFCRDHVRANEAITNHH